MASSVIKVQPIVGIAVTTGSNLQTATINAVRYGKILVVSYYFIPSANISRNDVLATFDIPTNFFVNMFDGQSCNLVGHTKNMSADRGTFGRNRIYGPSSGNNRIKSSSHTPK